MELDEKFCDVIVKRYLEIAGSAAQVYVLRDGDKIPYAQISQDAEEIPLF